MNEILSLIKTRERIIIASVMSAFAVVLAVVIGVVAGATNEEHTHRFDYYLEMGEDGRIDLVGECYDGECKDPHQVMDLESGVTEKVIVAATCCSDGETEYSYTNPADGFTYTYRHKVSPLPHSYVGQKIAAADGSVSIVADCANEGCTKDPFTIGEAEGLKLVSAVAATCHSPKIESYSFKVDGVDSVATVTTAENVAHKLNGVFVTEFLLSDGVYKYDTAGMTIANEQTVACGTQADAFYVCEECGVVQTVTVGKMDHSYLYIEADTVLPTTAKAGKAHVKCLNVDCTEDTWIELPIVSEENKTATEKLSATEQNPKVVTYKYSNDAYGINVEFDLEVGDKLSHAYEYDFGLSLNGKGDMTLALVGTCSQDGCEASHVRYELESLDFTTTNTATCYDPGETIWICKFEGEEYRFSAANILGSNNIPHNLQYDPGLTVMPNLESEGTAYLVCQNAGCTYKQDVTLPKAETGDQPQIRVESNSDGDFFVYKYTHTCTYTYNGEEIVFTVEGEVKEKTHIHRRDYTLNKASGENSELFFRQGICRNEFGDCTEIIEYIPVTPTLVTDTTSCVQSGERHWIYTDDEISCELIEYIEAPGHSYSWTINEAPDYDNDGVVHIYCANNNCAYSEDMAIPKMSDKNTAEVEIEGKKYLVYMYTITDRNNLEILQKFEIEEPTPVTN